MYSCLLFLVSVEMAWSLGCGTCDLFAFVYVFLTFVAGSDESWVIHYEMPHSSCFIPRWLKEQKKLNIFVEPRVRVELLTESSYYNFVQTWQDGELWNNFAMK